jgi:gamma-glutamyltranspeptidase/glutathione hydrolase
MAIKTDEMPEYGVIPITVPGAPSAWAALNKRFGRLPLTKIAEPAIEYAKNGYPCSPSVAEFWGYAQKAYHKRLDLTLFKDWNDTFTIQGETPQPGQTVRLPHHAETLRKIAESGAAAFYTGELADLIDAYIRKNNGFLRKSDLETHAPEWVKPLSAVYRGYDIWEIPPNGQGLVALMALAVLDGMELKSPYEPYTVHQMIEAVKIAFTDGQRYIAEPKHMPVTAGFLLSPALTAVRRSLVKETAIDPNLVPLVDHGTVYLCAADGDGTMVSYIQSNYMGFGSGVVVPGTGIALQNRGASFSLDPKHPNVLAPGKRPYHTIIPGFITKDGKPVGPFGIMGGFMQPQAHVQVLANMLDFGMNPQSALDAPRWMWQSGKRVTLELGIPEHVAAALRHRGHEVEYAALNAVFGRGQMILRNEHGTLTAATEPRCDGAAVVW